MASVEAKICVWLRHFYTYIHKKVQKYRYRLEKGTLINLYLYCTFMLLKLYLYSFIEYSRLDRGQTVVPKF